MNSLPNSPDMTSYDSPICPCGSGQTLGQCCGVFHGGVAAPTAEALMRSRYAAYVLGLPEYVWQTWHESTRPTLEDLGGTGLQWIHLSILSCQQGQPGDAKGEVCFAASYVGKDKGKCLTETSRFLQQGGRWYYVDGDCKVNDITRNQACPCGSGKKLKRCCLAV